MLHPSEIALLLDFDGTLVDVAATPDAVVVSDELQHLLKSLCMATNGALALITGRSLESLDAVLGVVIEACGSHGAEWRDKGNQPPSAADIKNLVLIGDALATFSRQHNLLLEEKVYSTALHFRGAEHLESTIDQWLDENIVRFLDLRVVPGKCVREIQLAGMHKGKAVEKFMQRSEFSDRIPVYIGDDTTDEDAFLWVNQAGGVSVKVGEGETQAYYRLQDRHAVHRWLQSILIQEVDHA